MRFLFWFLLLAVAAVVAALAATAIQRRIPKAQALAGAPANVNGGVTVVVVMGSSRADTASIPCAA